MHILMFIEDTATRNTLAGLFRAIGHKVTAVAVTEAGTVKVPRDLESALIDLNVEEMPKGDTLQALSHVLKVVPTLILFGNDTDKDKITAVKLGPSKMIHKRCDVKVMIAEMESLIRDDKREAA